MDTFRKPILRRLFALVFLLSGLSVQTQTLYACNLMDGDPQTTCCCDEHLGDGCPMGGGCHTQHGGMSTGCCDITVEVDMQDAALASTTEAQLVTQLNAPQPPPALLTTTEITLALSGASAGTGIEYHPPPFWSVGTRTYLATQRLRI